MEAQQWIERVTGEKFPAGKNDFRFVRFLLRDRTAYTRIQAGCTYSCARVLCLGLPFEYALRDGVLLCKLMNKLAPGIIPKINTTGGDYKMMDNISQYVCG